MITVTMGKNIPEWAEFIMTADAANLEFTYKFASCPSNFYEVLNNNKYYVGKNWANAEHWRGAQYRKYIQLMYVYVKEILKEYYAVFRTYMNGNNDPAIIKNTINDIYTMSKVDKLYCEKYGNSNLELLKLMYDCLLNETDELTIIQKSIIKKGMPKSTLLEINKIWELENKDEPVPLESDAYIFNNGKLQLHVTPVILILTKPNNIIDVLFERIQNKMLCVNAAIEYELKQPITETSTLSVMFKDDDNNTTITTADNADTTTTDNADTTTADNADTTTADNTTAHNTDIVVEPEGNVYIKRGHITYSQWVARNNKTETTTNVKNTLPLYKCNTTVNLLQYDLRCTPQFVYVYTLELSEYDLNNFQGIFAEDNLLAMIIK